jgi:cobyrinic acid a,c-diamide synthase
MASDPVIQTAEKSGRAFIIAGSASGVGKTTVTLSIMAALRKRRLAVQPFKCGPDFIDCGHHSRVCARASRNLDGWMLSAGANRRIFSRAAKDAGVCVVEGVMGLFDGADGKSDAGSTAEIAKWLGLPVILVVDASAIARSAAALVHGFETFDPAVEVAGVIFNRVGGPAHYRLLKDALTTSTRAVPLGCLPSDERIRIPERYLGLITAGEQLLPDSALSLLGGLAEDSIDLNKLLECANSVPALRLAAPAADAEASSAVRSVRIGVARDKAFCFYYEDNLDSLRQAGAEIVEFSPLEDRSLPTGVDALYFGGGYPELFARQLSANSQMLASIKQAAQESLPMYAECGGLMYLAKEIVTKDGVAFPMAGVLPLHVQMTGSLVNFGYNEVCFTRDCLLGPAGTKVRGHSFHCSKMIDAGPLERVYKARNSLAGREEPEGFSIGNVLASYIHLHFLSSSGLALGFVRNVQNARQREVLISEAKRAY